ncbi:MAG: phenylacetic acid degradation bifunctional protein PaaZ, partial [Sphingobacteriia bacterium]
MELLAHYALGQWIKGSGEGQVLFNAVTGQPIARASTQGINMGSLVAYAREKGNKNLRKMSFHERGLMLRALALHLREHLPQFYALSYQTGATKADSWVDIEGGIGNLFAYASLRRRLPDTPFCLDGEHHPLGKTNAFMGHHLLVPKEGLALHINAFNFPVWGMLEKIAVNLLAGMPAIVKPATLTSFLTQAVVKEIVASNILPEGALQLICGSAGDILDHLNNQDVVTFTGSASTGLMLKSHPQILKENIPFTMEADSLNAIVLGDDVHPDMPEWDLFIKEVRKEITTKCGQKCTAVRRIFVPEDKIDQVEKALGQALAQTVIGNPLNEKVRMGSLAGESQRKEVKAQVEKLLSSSQLVYGSMEGLDVLDADATQGAFMSPLLLRNNQPFVQTNTHDTEPFGPVATLMPYKDLTAAIELVNMGKGSLVSSIVTHDQQKAKDYVLGAGTFHGRILVLDRDCAKENTGHGSPLPLLVHGGPGRAGGGEEMGGLRGIKHYMQRLAIQGSPDMITAISGVYQPGAKGLTDGIHPFKKDYDSLRIGDQLTSARRVITAEDINA